MKKTVSSNQRDKRQASGEKKRIELYNAAFPTDINNLKRFFLHIHKIKKMLTAQKKVTSSLICENCFFLVSKKEKIKQFNRISFPRNAINQLLGDINSFNTILHGESALFCYKNRGFFFGRAHSRRWKEVIKNSSKDS